MTVQCELFGHEPDECRPSHHRNTPSRIVELFRQFDRIRLDPCSNLHSVVRADVEWYGPPHSPCGLATPWADSRPGIVFFQPPWHELLPWAQKAAREWRDHGVESIGWTHHDHSTVWCRYLLQQATVTALWHRRVNHPVGGVVRGTGSKFANTGWYFGPRLDRFVSLVSPYATAMVRAGSAFPAQT